MTAVQASVAAVDGLSNFRDFGGHATADGRRVVSGRLYRSANPASLTPAGMTQLDRLGVRTVIDLRGQDERAKALAGFDPRRIALRPAPVEPKTSARLRSMLSQSDVRAAHVREVMIESYRGYVHEAASAFGDAFQHLLAQRDGATLIHCTAGKDRTGFVVAVLQAALGVPRAAILDDYLETNRSWDRASAAGHLPLGSDVLEPVFVADAAYLGAAFEEIERRDGEPVAFIRRATAGRVTPDDLDTLIDRRQQP